MNIRKHTIIYIIIYNLYILPIMSFYIQTCINYHHKIYRKHYLFKSQKLYLTTNIVIVGKRNGGEEWIQNGYNEYEKRLRSIMNIETIFLKTNDELLKYVKNNTKLLGYIIAMDEHGKQFTSIDFSSYLYNCYEEGGANLSFIIGGFDGLPNEIKLNYPLISLSKMTWTHQMARLLLIEQIYRASEIRKGSNYHKE